jgi:hypothetical protein
MSAIRRVALRYLFNHLRTNQTLFNRNQISSTKHLQPIPRIRPPPPSHCRICEFLLFPPVSPTQSQSPDPTWISAATPPRSPELMPSTYTRTHNSIGMDFFDSTTPRRLEHEMCTSSMMIATFILTTRVNNNNNDNNNNNNKQTINRKNRNLQPSISTALSRLSTPSSAHPSAHSARHCQRRRSSTCRRRTRLTSTILARGTRRCYHGWNFDDALLTKLKNGFWLRSIADHIGQRVLRFLKKYKHQSIVKHQHRAESTQHLRGQSPCCANRSR